MKHIMSLSGGKDSSALAVLLSRENIREKYNIENLEYVFCDTGLELPEVYSYLAKMELLLDIKIIYLKSSLSLDELIELRGGYLPTANARYCTTQLKVFPYLKHLRTYGSDEITSYIGIRNDEQHRTGSLATDKNVTTVYPFIDLGLNREDIITILKDSELGLPEYYKWRSRSGCYLCFFQRKVEWIGLLERHPDLYWKASAYEHRGFTWCGNKESLKDLARPERIAEVKRRAALARKSNNAIDLWREIEEDDDLEDNACNICHV